MDVWLFDASTLILLAKVELLDVFLDDFQDIPFIPQAVEAESTGDSSRPDGVLIRQRIMEGRIAVREASQPAIVSRLLQDFRLGRGEGEALALALEAGQNVVVATDDRNAIRACKVLRIEFVTSIGILVRAVEKGLLTRGDGLGLLEKLRSYGRFRVEVIEEARRQIGGTHDGKSSENS